MTRFASLTALVALFYGCGNLAVFGSEVQEIPYKSATFLGQVRFAQDNTEAIQARAPLFEVPRAIRVVPQGPPPPFAGRSGIQFATGPEPTLVQLGDPGAPLFPGPEQSGLTPGDPQVSVGPSHVVGCINGRISFFTKAGTTTFSSPTSAFFASLGSYHLIFDPRTFYDTYHQRFWILYPAILTNAFNKSYFLIALSDDSDPNGNWSLWALDSSMNGNQNTTNWSDYPGFGHSQEAIVITANMYTPGWGFAYGKVRVALKDQFLAGSPTIAYTDFWNFTDASGAQAASMQPARSIGLAKMPFFCSAGGSNRINVWGIQNVTGSPSLVARQVTVPSFSSPPNARQQGGSVTLWTVDARVFDVYCRNHRLTVIHNVNRSGFAAQAWYEINALNMPTSVSLVQNGVLWASNTDVYFGAMAINGSGHIGAAFSRSSSSEYISIYIASRYADDPLGTFGSQALLKAGTRYYTGEGGSNIRWGDYTGLCVDPANDSVFWGINMLPHPSLSGNWVTEIFSFDVGRKAIIQGQVNLQFWAVSPAGISGTLELRAPGTTTVLHQYPIALNASGQFTIDPAYFGNYDLALKLPRWLRMVIPVNITAGQNSVTLNLLNGDANNDNAVDVADLNTVLGRFGFSHPLADLNGNGSVDVPDLNVVLSNFGLSGVP